jgi:hypothetical protein
MPSRPTATEHPGESAPIEANSACVALMDVVLSDNEVEEVVDGAELVDVVDVEDEAVSLSELHATRRLVVTTIEAVVIMTERFRFITQR